MKYIVTVMCKCYVAVYLHTYINHCVYMHIHIHTYVHMYVNWMNCTNCPNNYVQKKMYYILEGNNLLTHSSPLICIIMYVVMLTL